MSGNQIIAQDQAYYQQLLELLKNKDLNNSDVKFTLRCIKNDEIRHQLYTVAPNTVIFWLDDIAKKLTTNLATVLGNNNAEAVANKILSAIMSDDIIPIAPHAGYNIPDPTAHHQTDQNHTNSSLPAVNSSIAYPDEQLLNSTSVARPSATNTSVSSSITHDLGVHNSSDDSAHPLLNPFPNAITAYTTLVHEQKKQDHEVHQTLSARLSITGCKRIREDPSIRISYIRNGELYSIHAHLSEICCNEPADTAIPAIFRKIHDEWDIPPIFHIYTKNCVQAEFKPIDCSSAIAPMDELELFVAFCCDDRPPQPQSIVIQSNTDTSTIRFIKKRRIYTGKHSHVDLCSRADTNEEVVVKLCDSDEEQRILNYIKGCNGIVEVKTIGICVNHQVTDNKIHAHVMPSLCSLEDRYSQGCDDDIVRLNIGQMLIKAVRNLHQFGFIHRDIKPANVLCDNHGHVYLADLDCATFVRSYVPSLPNTEFVGTRVFASANALNLGPTCYDDDFESLCYLIHWLKSPSAFYWRSKHIKQRPTLAALQASDAIIEKLAQIWAI